MEYLPLLELPEEIHALVVERVACNSFQDLYGPQSIVQVDESVSRAAQCILFLRCVICSLGLNMPSQMLKSCYAEGNPSTLYIKGVQFYFTFGLQEEGPSLMKRAAYAEYECVVYTHAITQAIFLCDGQYFHGIPREWVQRIGKLVRSVKWGWDANVQHMCGDNVSACGTLI
ncbi:hypothetical protein DY000_02040302 [Brassica cretica]|uniref:Uncharacterized protein n=1 Tax=Brassica cretica TaxID=69181 RepID=A0ABQ7B6I2_BRACR|nr:hypothetical protein DY000_02040302 [Brassica cretica]